jgi:RNA polymerase sigma-70 factor (ECF subfamily)
LNRESVERLLVTEYPGLLVLLRRRARDPQLAEDMLNEATAITLNNLDSGRIADPSHIGGYVFQVAMNLLRNHRRSHADNVNKRAELTDDLAVSPPAAEAMEHDWAERVRRLVEQLPSARDREMLRRFYLDEEEKIVICGQLQISPLQFDKIIFRAKKRLLEAFNSRGFRKGDFISLLVGGIAMAATTVT